MHLFTKTRSQDVCSLQKEEFSLHIWARLMSLERHYSAQLLAAASVRG